MQTALRTTHAYLDAAPVVVAVERAIDLQMVGRDYEAGGIAKHGAKMLLSPRPPPATRTRARVGKLHLRDALLDWRYAARSGRPAQAARRGGGHGLPR